MQDLNTRSNVQSISGPRNDLRNDPSTELPTRDPLAEFSHDFGLEVRPDPDIQDLVPSFVENRHRELAEMLVAASQNDYNLLRRSAHTWKGICRPYGFVHLETLSKLLEKAAEAEDRASVDRMLMAIKFHLERVRIIVPS